MPSPYAPVSEENPNDKVTNEGPRVSEANHPGEQELFGHAYSIMCNLWPTPDTHIQEVDICPCELGTYMHICPRTSHMCTCMLAFGPRKLDASLFLLFGRAEAVD